MKQENTSRFFSGKITPGTEYILLVNVVIPVIDWIIYRIIEPWSYPLTINPLTFFLGYAVFLLILVMNIIGIRRYPSHRRWFIAIIILNLVAAVFSGENSFFTMLPELPFLIKSYYLIATQ